MELISANSLPSIPSDLDDPLLTLSLSGSRFRVYTSSLLRYPKTRLGKLAMMVMGNEGNCSDRSIMEETEDPAEPLFDHADESKLQFYFERSQFAFDSVLNLYRQDTLHVPEGQCPVLFMEQLKYWMIDLDNVSKCCREKIDLFLPKFASLEEDRNMLDLNENEEEKEKLILAQAKCSTNCTAARARIWHFLEDPTGSIFAMVYMTISMGFVVATIILLVMSSMPEYQLRELDPETNQTRIEVNPRLELGDTVCVIWFSMEHVLRVWAAPDRCAYLRSPLSCIDFAAILPFYIEIFFNCLGFESRLLANIRRSLLMMRILRGLRVMRVFRVLKVARYSKGFQSVGRTLRKCYKELIMLVMFMFTTNIMFSTVMYFLESENKTYGFESIPGASWWCIITMTTVGYGDVYPKTVAGKVVAGFISISGIILLAFPVSIIVENFHEQYVESSAGSDTDSTEAARRAVFTGMFVSEVPVKRKPRPKYIHI